MANPEEAIMSDKQPLPTGTQLSALDPTFRERPHEYLDRLRAEEPVHRDTELGRLFLTRFEDVRSVLSNRSLSVDPRKAPPGSTLAILCSSSAGRMRDRRSSTLLGPRSRRPRWSWRGRASMIISLGQ